MKKTIAIIGGSQEGTYKKIGQKLGCNILYHNGKSRNGGTKKEFLPIVRKADCVVVLVKECGHISMDMFKKLCKENGTKYKFHRSSGATGAISLGLDAINQEAA